MTNNKYITKVYIICTANANKDDYTVYTQILLGFYVGTYMFLDKYTKATREQPTIKTYTYVQDGI